MENTVFKSSLVLGLIPAVDGTGAPISLSDTRLFYPRLMYSEIATTGRILYRKAFGLHL